MDFVSLDVAHFLKDLQDFKETYLDEFGQPEDEFTEICFDSIDLLLKELKGKSVLWKEWR